MTLSFCSKRFGSHIPENHLATLFALFIGQTWHQMDQKSRYLAKITQKNQCFGPDLAVFWQESYFFGEGAKVLEPTYLKTNWARRSHYFFGRAWHQMDQKGQDLKSRLIVDVLT